MMESYAMPLWCSQLSDYPGPCLWQPVGARRIGRDTDLQRPPLFEFCPWRGNVLWCHVHHFDYLAFPKLGLASGALTYCIDRPARWLSGDNHLHAGYRQTRLSVLPQAKSSTGHLHDRFGWCRVCDERPDSFYHWSKGSEFCRWCTVHFYGEGLQGMVWA